MQISGLSYLKLGLDSGFSQKKDLLCRRSSKGEALERVISQGFRPGVEGRRRRLGDIPEPAQEMMDERDGGCWVGALGQL